MKLIDEKGRLFGKMSVIDFGILLLVIMIAIGAFVKFMVLDQTAIVVEAAPVQYTLEVRGVRDWALRNIREGDAVFAGGVYVGTITNVSYTDMEVYVSGDGEVWLAYLPDRYVVFLEIAATATVNDRGYFVSRTVPMAVGNSLTEFTTRYAEFVAIVAEINLYG